MCSTRERLASTLRERRKELGFTLRRAAEYAQIGPSTLSRWEAGSSVPMVPELESLLKALRMSNEDIRRILVSIDAPRAVKAALSAAPSFKVPTGGDLLRILRMRSHRTLPEVAEMFGVSASTVSRWERSEIHPSSETLLSYVGKFPATQEEARAILATGVGKIRPPRPTFEPAIYREELQQLEEIVDIGGADGTEFRLLCLQSNLWWERSSNEAAELLRFACAIYARYLLAWQRFSEANKQTEAVLQNADPFDDLGLEALRIQGCCAAYRGNIIRPHLGLYTLQTCLQRVNDPNLRTRVLIDMSDLSLLSCRSKEAESYAQRAQVLAEHSTPYLQAEAHAAWLAARNDSEALMTIGKNAAEFATFAFREIILMSSSQSLERSILRYEELSRKSKELKSAWSTHRLEFARRLSQSSIAHTA